MPYSFRVFQPVQAHDFIVTVDSQATLKNSDDPDQLAFCVIHSVLRRPSKTS